MGHWFKSSVAHHVPPLFSGNKLNAVSDNLLGLNLLVLAFRKL